jgi:phosphoribosylformylglycinamidine cyclo-ligase
MLRVFNCGVGMVVIVAGQHAQQASDLLRAAGETAWRIGTVQARAAREAQTVIE